MGMSMNGAEDDEFVVLLVCPSARTSAVPQLASVWVRDGTVEEVPELPVKRI
jgi:hypothetical protein